MSQLRDGRSSVKWTVPLTERSLYLGALYECSGSIRGYQEQWLEITGLVDGICCSDVRYTNGHCTNLVSFLEGRMWKHEIVWSVWKMSGELWTSSCDWNIVIQKQGVWMNIHWLKSGGTAATKNDSLKQCLKHGTWWHEVDGDSRSLQITALLIDRF
jgi:hypothetical protein